MSFVSLISVIATQKMIHSHWYHYCSPVLHTHTHTQWCDQYPEYVYFPHMLQIKFKWFKNTFYNCKVWIINVSNWIPYTSLTYLLISSWFTLLYVCMYVCYAHNCREYWKFVDLIKEWFQNRFQCLVICSDFGKWAR